jgi:hypothetical protein
MSPAPVGRVGHAGQLLAEHEARSVNSVTMDADPCASHPGTHVGSVGKQVMMQTAMSEQLESLGQLVGFRQQVAAMHATQAAVDVPKI